MDKNEGRKEEIRKGKSTKTDTLYLPVDVEKKNEVNGLVESIEEARLIALFVINEDEHSLFSDKRQLRRLKNLINVSYEMAQWTVVTAFALDCTSNRLAHLEKIVEVLIEKLNIDLPSVKAELREMKTELAMPIVRMDEFVRQINEMRNKYNKVREENDLAT